MKKRYLLFTFFIFCFFSFSQSLNREIDSLLRLYESKNLDTYHELEVVNKLVLVLGEFDFEKAKHYNKQLYNLSKKNKLNKGFGYYYMNITNYNMIVGNFKKAEQSALKAMSFFKIDNDTNNYILAVYAYCFALDYQGNLEQAEKNALEAVKACESKPNNLTCEKILEKNNIQGYLVNTILSYIAIYLGKKDAEKASFYSNKIDKNGLNKNDLLYFYGLQSKYYILKNNLKEAYFWANLIKQIDPDDVENLKTLYEIQKHLKNYEKASNYLEKYAKLQINKLKNEKENQVAQYEAIYQLKEKDNLLQKNKLLAEKKELELKGQKKYTVLFILIASLLLLIAILLLFYFLSKKRSNRLLFKKNEELMLLNSLLTKSLNEKDLLLKEIHHRFKNNLQLVMSLLNIQAQDSNDAVLNEFLEKGRSRIETMALIHQNLYLSNSISKINFQNYLEVLTSHLKKSFGLDQVTFNIQTNNLYFNVETAIPLGLIINEVVCNSLKYAFPNKEGEVTIHIKKQNEEYYHLCVADNGIGIENTQNNNDSKSIGLELVSLLVMQLKGTIKRLNSSGTSYQIIFRKIN